MKKFLATTAVALALTAGMVTVSKQGEAETLNQNIEFTVIAPVDLTEGRALNFGNVSYASGGTVVVPDDGSAATTTGGAGQSGTGEATAQFDGTCEGTAALTTTLQGTATAVPDAGGNAAADMTVGTFDLDGTLTACVAGAIATQNVGGTLTFGTAAPQAGAYNSATFTIQVEYQ